MLRKSSLSGPMGRRGKWAVAIMLVAAVTLLFAFTRPAAGPAADPPPPAAVPPTPQISMTTRPQGEQPRAIPPRQEPEAAGAPRTKDFRELASAAAKTIYTWDTRSASYSDVYSGLRNWWHLLPDGSNPLAVFVQEFESTGVNAGSYVSLAGQQAHRSATVDSLQCDSELAKVRERPAPWDGLHVCTVFVQVVEESASAHNTYSAPVSVMVNCPPASTAPADTCVMVGFYAASSRIVY
jgi:hypothetical protein